MQRNLGQHAQYCLTNWKTIWNPTHLDSQKSFEGVQQIHPRNAMFISGFGSACFGSILSADGPQGSLLLDSALLDGILSLIKETQSTLKLLCPISQVDKSAVGIALHHYGKKMQRLKWWQHSRICHQSISSSIEVCPSVCLPVLTLVHQSIRPRPDTGVASFPVSWVCELSFSHSPLKASHWRKRTRNDGHCLFFTILFMSHNSSVYLCVLSVRQNIQRLTHGPLLSQQSHYQPSSSSSTDQMYGLSAWIAHSPPGKSISSQHYSTQIVIVSRIKAWPI